MLSNPTYGKSWKTDLERMGGILNESPAWGSPGENAGDDRSNRKPGDVR